MADPISNYFSWQSEFEEISCFKDEQVSPFLSKLQQSNQLVSILDDFIFNKGHVSALEKAFENIKQLKSVEAFQRWIEDHIIPIVRKGCASISIDGIDNLDPESAYIFISNHRDIVMDPLLLNMALRENGFSTAHCAIGDNLLISPIAESLARLNKCFKVIRSLKSPKAILKAMKVQSQYIAYRHFTDNSHIWIAQKEGRSKDNSDITNPALIKMLGLSRPTEIDLDTYYEELKIVPVCYSYEWDPCDVDKAKQIAAAREDDYAKDASEDVVAVQKGLKGNKGHIRLSFGAPIAASDNLTMSHSDIAKHIDLYVKHHYQLYPVNYAAYKKMARELPEHCPYDKDELNSAWKQLEKRIKSESKEVQQQVIEAYAAPVSNSFAQAQSDQ